MCVCVRALALESILVDVTNSGNRVAKCRGCGALKHRGRSLLEGAVLVHVDINRSSLIFHAVKVKRGPYN